jgi:hypothetical protein
MRSRRGGDLTVINRRARTSAASERDGAPKRGAALALVACVLTAACETAPLGKNGGAIAIAPPAVADPDAPAERVSNGSTPALPLVPIHAETLPAQDHVTLHEKNSATDEVVARIASAARRTILVAAGVRPRVWVWAEDVSWRVALQRLAFSARCEVTQLPGGTLVLERDKQPRLWGRGLRGPSIPVRSVLEALAVRAGAQLLLDDDVDGTWTGGLPALDPARALAEVVKRSRLHARRFGRIVAVASRPLPDAGDEDLDPERDWAKGLSDRRVTLSLDKAPFEVAVAALSATAGVPLNSRLDRLLWDRHGSITLSAQDVPWTDLVLFFARCEEATIRRDGDGLVLEQAGGRGRVLARGAPAGPFFELLAECTGRRFAAGAPSVRGSVSVDLASVSLEDAFGALAALHGLAWVPGSDGSGALEPVAAQPLESLAPAAAPVSLRDGHELTLRLEATVHGPANAVLVSGTVLVQGKEIALPDRSTGFTVRLASVLGETCILSIEGPSGAEESLELRVPSASR